MESQVRRKVDQLTQGRQRLGRHCRSEQRSWSTAAEICAYPWTTCRRPAYFRRLFTTMSGFRGAVIVDGVTKKSPAGGRRGPGSRKPRDLPAATGRCRRARRSGPPPAVLRPGHPARRRRRQRAERQRPTAADDPSGRRQPAPPAPLLQLRQRRGGPALARRHRREVHPPRRRPGPGRPLPRRGARRRPHRPRRPRLGERRHHARRPPGRRRRHCRTGEDPRSEDRHRPARPLRRRRRTGHLPLAARPPLPALQPRPAGRPAAEPDRQRAGVKWREVARETERSATSPTAGAHARPQPGTRRRQRCLPPVPGLLRRRRLGRVGRLGRP